MKASCTVFVICPVLLFAACAPCDRAAGGKGSAVVPESAAQASISAQPVLPQLSREDFNRLAAAADLPLFWMVDEKEPGTLNPEELAVMGVEGDLSKWVSGGVFTQDFKAAAGALVERRRQEAVARELNQARPTPVISDLTAMSPDEKELVRHILKAAELVDRLHRAQRGSARFDADLGAMRPDDRALFMRNNGPWCEAPLTADDPFCNAVPTFPKQVYSTYPDDEAHELPLCAKLQAQPNAAALMDPFVTVRHDGRGGYEPVPLTRAYPDAMTAIAAELDTAAGLAKKVGENAFATYLAAAAGSFRSNDWNPADEAWVAMNATNSKFFLRIAPDEVYWDLCQQKGGFHTTFALIDRGSLELQEKLNPLRLKMENALGALTQDYRPRPVSFQMPDFIQIIMNSGDARKGIGATIGQSLPNWGSVVERGGSRTVVMTNLYQDPDSRVVAKQKASELLGPETLKYYSEEQRISLIDIILHEATHNLGPYSDYRVDGKRPAQIFGGGLATVLEELKAQTGSWFYVPMLLEAQVIDELQAKELYTHALVWSFGHLSQGLFAPDGNPKPYSQLSAVIVGRLVEGGALEWVVVNQADGSQKGLFEFKYDMVPLVVGTLMRDIVSAKATGNVEAAKAIVDPYVSGTKKSLVHIDEIKARLAPFPRSTMVYQVKL